MLGYGDGGGSPNERAAQQRVEAGEAQLHKENGRIILFALRGLTRCWTDPSNASMNVLFTYEELVRRFPTLSVGTVTPMRCALPVRGQGRHIKRLRDQPPQRADVAIGARPAGVLSVQFNHSWPPGLASDELARLDDALLLGIAEGIAREEWPPMECAITSLEVGYFSGETTPVAVRIAAAVAVRDMCRQPGWEGGELGTSPPDVA